MHRNRRLVVSLLMAALILVPGAARAQEVDADERPDPGFRVLGPRTVVSFVRQSVPGVAPETEPVWRSVVHVSNVGNGPLVAAAIFVSSGGDHRAGVRFPVAPGQTVSVPVDRILAGGLGETGTGVEMPPPPTSDAGVATGIVILRFFAPTDADTDRFFAQVVTAEQFVDRGPNTPPLIFQLDVERPQPQAPVRRRMENRQR